jgi:hypothetical protein
VVHRHYPKALIASKPEDPKHLQEPLLIRVLMRMLPARAANPFALVFVPQVVVFELNAFLERIEIDAVHLVFIELLASGKSACQ